MRQVVDPIDHQSLVKLDVALAELYEERVFQLSYEHCHDRKFVEDVMTKRFHAEFHPSTDTLRALLNQDGLSLSPTSEMYTRILSILTETCVQSAILRKRDSGVSVGDTGQFSDEDPGGEDPDVTMPDRNSETVNPQHLSGPGGINHFGIGGTHSSQARRGV